MTMIGATNISSMKVNDDDKKILEIGRTNFDFTSTTKYLTPKTNGKYVLITANALKYLIDKPQLAKIYVKIGFDYRLTSLINSTTNVMRLRYTVQCMKNQSTSKYKSFEPKDNDGFEFEEEDEEEEQDDEPTPKPKKIVKAKPKKDDENEDGYEDQQDQDDDD